LKKSREHWQFHSQSFLNKPATSRPARGATEMRKRKSPKSRVRPDDARGSVDFRKKMEKIDDPNENILSLPSPGFVLDSLRSAIETERDKSMKKFERKNSDFFGEYTNARMIPKPLSFFLVKLGAPRHKWGFP
jgi:hypothetical protein